MQAKCICVTHKATEIDCNAYDSLCQAITITIISLKLLLFVALSKHQSASLVPTLVNQVNRLLHAVNVYVL